MKKNMLFPTILPVGFLIHTSRGLSQSVPGNIRVDRIYSDKNYNAFISLVKFRGRFYCAFRPGEAHVYGEDGIIKIMSSGDGKSGRKLHAFLFRDTTCGIPCLRLSETRNGIDYQLITELEIGGRPNEATIRVMPDGEMPMIIRREEKDRKAYLGRSQAPYLSWTFLEMPFFIGGPDFIALDDDHFVGGGRIDGKYTGLVSFTRDGGFREVLRLPSSADSSYPGFLVENGKIFVSYCSSHETGVSSIYFAEVPLSYVESQRVP